MALPTQKSIWSILKTFVVNTGGTGAPAMDIITEGTVKQIRRRCTIAEINAGVTLLNAIPGFKYRVVDAAMISIGGAAASTTTVDILGTQSAASVKLLATGIAQLTQNAKVTIGETGATHLANGLSFAENDANTGITANKTGASLTGSTHIDVLLQYTLVKA